MIRVVKRQAWRQTYCSTWRDDITSSSVRKQKTVISRTGPRPSRSSRLARGDRPSRARDPLRLYNRPARERVCSGRTRHGSIATYVTSQRHACGEWAATRAAVSARAPVGYITVAGITGRCFVNVARGRSGNRELAVLGWFGAARRQLGITAGWRRVAIGRGDRNSADHIQRGHPGNRLTTLILRNVRGARTTWRPFARVPLPGAITCLG